MSTHSLQNWLRLDDCQRHAPRLLAAWFALVIGCLGGMPANAEEQLPPPIAGFLQQHCFACHGAEKQESQVRFDQTSRFRIEDRNLWTLVHERVSTGEMPPEGRPQPSAIDKATVLEWIENQQRSLGTGSTRRLNRRELSAALQDVTGLGVDYAFSLPGDGKLAGFDTGVAALQDASSSVERVMQATRNAVDGIRFLEPPPSDPLFADLRNVSDPRRALDDWKQQGVNPKTRGFGVKGLGLLLEPKWVGERGSTEITVPVPENGHGVLRLRLVVAAKKFFPGVPNPHLWVEIGGKVIERREITATESEPEELICEVQLDDLAVETKGVTIDLSGRVEVPYAVDGFANEDKTKPEDKIPGGGGLFRPAYDKKAKPDEQPVPFVVLQEIEVHPNYVAAWPPRHWNVADEQWKDDRATAERLLGLWTQRAWRRPVSGAEQQRFLDLYQNLRGEGFSFDDALRASFQAVLLSAPFRYLPPNNDDDPMIAQHAIASRLSFMLTGAPPDAELRRLAAANKLRDAAVLSGQVERLLADPRSDAFFRPFVMQWLEMDQPITLTMDYFQKQDFRFGRFLKHSMKEETIQYVTALFAENRPAKELIASDWTMMNNSLAIHYGYDGIQGGQLRKQSLRAGDPRGGGILGQAGIQSMLCWMGDNWVIYRGAWALRHVLDDPPPPPPLEVPELDATAGENRGKTFRQLLEQHQADEKCSVCHRKIDPLGFAFQNFDISGRWRDVEYERYIRNELDGKIEWRGTGETRPVDTAGRLPRGKEFRDFAELKEILVTHYLDDIVRGVMKNLVIYATGRKPDVDDMAEIRSILAQQEQAGYRMQDLLKAVLCSRAFLEH